ncbi:MAG: response regulator [Gammaproteobacteria bacterium]|nr:response regulator [Gammaproteobacteria bacterium]
MNETSPTILVVDDEAEMREVHQLLLLDAGFQVVSAVNGKNAIEIIENKDKPIDIILSDVVMPEMDGYALCKYVKSQEDVSDTPFIFISSLDTLEEKIKGLECGADEYVTKPLQVQELSFKIRNLIELQSRNKNLKKEVMDSQSAAMEIMNFYGDLGQILEFYKVSIGANSFEELARLLFDVTGGYGLSCSIQFHLPDEVLSFGDKGEISPLEANVMTLARKKDRVLSIGARLVINYQAFTLLIKNMPVDNVERTGTLRDSLGVLCNAVEARLNSLLTEKNDAKKTEITEAVQEVLEQTKMTFADIERRSIKAIEGLAEEIETAFFSLDLREEQENHIREIVKSCMANTNKAFEKGIDLNEMFDDINQNLTEILNIKK